MSGHLTLVLGGARSGKSRYAEDLVKAAPAPWIYLATAQAFDTEMAVRIRRHRADRGHGWTTVEEPLDLVGALMRHTTPHSSVLVDCLTLWVSNLMGAGRDVSMACAAFADTLERLPGNVVLVSNEVGLGIVPDNALAREFRDHAGRLHQMVAERARRVVFVVAGLPMNLKG